MEYVLGSDEQVDVGSPQIEISYVYAAGTESRKRDGILQFKSKIAALVERLTIKKPGGRCQRHIPLGVSLGCNSASTLQKMENCI